MPYRRKASRVGIWVQRSTHTIVAGPTMAIYGRARTLGPKTRDRPWICSKNHFQRDPEVFVGPRSTPGTPDMFLGKFVGNTFAQHVVPERFFGFRSVFGSQDLIFALGTYFNVFQHEVESGHTHSLRHYFLHKFVAHKCS